MFMSSTRRVFGFVLIGLMITSCGGGTSSNTSNGSGSNDTLTFSVPSLGFSTTIDKSTSFTDIVRARRELETLCREGYNIGSRSYANCVREVRAAYNEAVNFISN